MEDFLQASRIYHLPFSQNLVLWYQPISKEARKWNVAVCPGSKGEKECWWTPAGSLKGGPLGGRLLDCHYWGGRGDEEAGRNNNVKENNRWKAERESGCSCTFLCRNIFIWTRDFFIWCARWAHFGKRAGSVFSLVLNRKHYYFLSAKLYVNWDLAASDFDQFVMQMGSDHFTWNDSLVFPALLMFSTCNSSVV